MRSRRFSLEEIRRGFPANFDVFQQGELVRKTPLKIRSRATNFAVSRRNGNSVAVVCYRR